MPEILAPAAATVKPSDEFLATRPELILASLEGADDWTMDDVEADERAAESAAYAMSEAGLPTW